MVSVSIEREKSESVWVDFACNFSDTKRGSRHVVLL